MRGGQAQQSPATKYEAPHTAGTAGARGGAAAHSARPRQMGTRSIAAARYQPCVTAATSTARLSTELTPCLQTGNTPKSSGPCTRSRSQHRARRGSRLMFLAASAPAESAASASQYGKALGASRHCHAKLLHPSKERQGASILGAASAEAVALRTRGAQKEGRKRRTLQGRAVPVAGGGGAPLAELLVQCLDAVVVARLRVLQLVPRELRQEKAPLHQLKTFSRAAAAPTTNIKWRNAQPHLRMRQ